MKVNGIGFVGIERRFAEIGLGCPARQRNHPSAVKLQLL